MLLATALSALAALLTTLAGLVCLVLLTAATTLVTLTALLAALLIVLIAHEGSLHWLCEIYFAKTNQGRFQNVPKIVGGKTVHVAAV